jgi:hypothetical protein
MNWILLVVAIIAVAGIYFVADIYSKIGEIKFRFEEQIKLYEAQKQAKQKPTKKKKKGGK